VKRDAQSGSEVFNTGGRATLRGHAFLLAVMALIALLAVPAIASAAPKTIVNSLGSPVRATTGGLFNTPRGVAVNETGSGGVAAGTFYVVDSANNRIQQFDPAGTFVRTWGWGVKDGEAEFEICNIAENCQAGLAGNGAGQLSAAQGIAVDQATGALYVTNQGNRRVEVFTAKGIFVGAFGWRVRVSGAAEALQFCTAASGCQGGLTGSATAVAKGGQFNAALGYLAVAPPGSPNAGDVYIANKTLRRVDQFKPTIESGIVTGISFVRAFGKDVKTGLPTTFEVCEVSTECKQGAATTTEAGGFNTSSSPSDVAVDSEGNVFVLDFGNKRVQEFSPVPAPITATFGSGAIASVFGAGAELFNVAIDRSSTPNHVLVSGKRIASENRVGVVELSHAGEEPVLHGPELSPTSANGLAAAPASLGGNVYLSTATNDILQGVYVLSEAPTVDPVTTFDGTTATFEGEVVSGEFEVQYHFEYSTDGETWKRLPGEDIVVPAQPGRVAVSQEASGLTGSQPYRVRLVQNRPEGPGIATSAETTFATLAAKPTIFGSVVWPVGDTEATFNAYLDPQNESTSYHFEYGPGDCSAIPNPCVSLPSQEASGGGPRLVLQTAAGLAPGTLYHYRLVASNATGTTAGPDRLFETFAPGTALPDGRAFELVTPPETGSVSPTAIGLGSTEGNCFDTFLATADGNRVAFATRGGSLPGLESNGVADLYESVRTPTGWTTISQSASSTQTTQPSGLCLSPDHLYSTLVTDDPPSDEGSLVVNDNPTSYIREPNGSFSLVGIGELGTDPRADAKWISEGGGHVVFTSSVQLEPEAPELVGPGPVWSFGGVVQNPPVNAVYDRIPGGATRVASLLPGDVSPDPSTETIHYLGTSFDGSAVVFAVEEQFEGETTVYERRDNATTVPVATGPLPGSFEFGGTSRNGDKVVYVESDTPELPGPQHQRGNIFVFDADTETTAQVNSGGGAALVNVSEDASHVYFTSQADLTGSEENSLGDTAAAGEDNLYVWDEDSEDVRFIAGLDRRDIVPEGAVFEPSLANWATEVATPTPSVDRGRQNNASRTTPDGSVMLFESHGRVTEYDSGGRTEIYRYASDSGELVCVSCPPVGIPPTSSSEVGVVLVDPDSEADAALQPKVPFSVTSALIHIQNVTDDGEKVFFQTQSPLVPGDVNGTWDVYEWEAGQAYLISSGTSPLPSFLYSMTPSGSDVFFTTTDRLVPEDPSTVASIYDAREGGGFASQAVPSPPCQPDACQGTGAARPPLSSPGSATFSGPAGGKRPLRCGKKARRIKRDGKVRCVKKKRVHKGKRHHRANDDRRQGR
jgi:NHL repeat